MWYYFFTMPETDAPDFHPIQDEKWSTSYDAGLALTSEINTPDTDLHLLYNQPEDYFKKYFPALEANQQNIEVIKQAAIAGFLDGSERQIRRLSKDGLCAPWDVLNRAGIEAVAQIEAAKMKDKRPGAHQGVAVLLADIDGLSRLNDTIGHSGGDEAIRHLAKTLHDSVRETDPKGRYGGDEIVVLLFLEDLATAERIMRETIEKIFSSADRWRQEMQQQTYGDKQFPGDNRSLSKGRYPGRISIGWHFLTPEDIIARYEEYNREKIRGRAASLIELLTKEADEKMYRMKISTPTPPPDVPPQTVSS